MKTLNVTTNNVTTNNVINNVTTSAVWEARKAESIKARREMLTGANVNKDLRALNVWQGLKLLNTLIKGDEKAAAASLTLCRLLDIVGKKKFQGEDLLFIDNVPAESFPSRVAAIKACNAKAGAVLVGIRANRKGDAFTLYEIGTAGAYSINNLINSIRSRYFDKIEKIESGLKAIYQANDAAALEAGEIAGFSLSGKTWEKRREAISKKARKAAEKAEKERKAAEKKAEREAEKKRKAAEKARKEAEKAEKKEAEKKEAEKKEEAPKTQGGRNAKRSGRGRKNEKAA